MLSEISQSQNNKYYYNSTYRKYLYIINFTETESKRWLLGAEKGGKEELFKRYRVPVLQDEKALEPVS